MFTNLWNDLPAEVQAQFEAASSRLEKKRGEYVYQQGEQPKGLYFIESGLVGLVLIGANSGKEHLLRFFRAGQFFGHRALFSQEGYHGSTQALEPTRLRFVPKSILLATLEKHSSLYKSLVLVLAKELRRSEEQHVMILENQILSRIALALVYLKDLNPDHNWTRQEIANFTASTTSTVIKAMAEIENMGLIRQEGRHIQILNRDGLIDLQDKM